MRGFAGVGDEGDGVDDVKDEGVAGDGEDRDSVDGELADPRGANPSLLKSASASA